MDLTFKAELCDLFLKEAYPNIVPEMFDLLTNSSNFFTLIIASNSACIVYDIPA